MQRNLGCCEGEGMGVKALWPCSPQRWVLCLCQERVRVVRRTCGGRLAHRRTVYQQQLHST